MRTQNAVIRPCRFWFVPAGLWFGIRALRAPFFVVSSLPDLNYHVCLYPPPCRCDPCCWNFQLCRQPCYTYLWSFLFKSYSSAQNAFLFHNWITGLILPIATTIMSLFEGTISDVAQGISVIFRICPQFALGNGLMNMSFMAIFGFFDDKTYTPLDMRIAGNSLVYMAVLTVVYFFLLLVVER